MKLKFSHFFKIFVWVLTIVFVVGLVFSADLMAKEKKSKKWKEGKIKWCAPFNKITKDLTDEQIEEFKKMKEFQEYQTLSKEMADLDKKSDEYKEKRKKRSELQKIIRTEGMKLLTDEQRKKIEEKEKEAKEKRKKGKKSKKDKECEKDEDDDKSKECDK